VRRLHRAQRTYAALYAALCAALCCAACGHTAPQAPPTPQPPHVTLGAYPPYGHAQDYSWIAGRIAARLNGCTYIVFGKAARTQWGGRMALIARPDVLANFPSGDMVVASGRLTWAPQGECGVPAFAAGSIEEH